MKTRTPGLTLLAALGLGVSLGVFAYAFYSIGAGLGSLFSNLFMAITWAFPTYCSVEYLSRPRRD